MRPNPNPAIERIRQLELEVKHCGESAMGTSNGVFAVRRGPTILRIISSIGMGWEHVSVSTASRCPHWDEMCFVKDLFWLPTECVVQYHPPESDWVNNHPYCLHLFRPTEGEILRPPAILVGIKDEGIPTPERARELFEKHNEIKGLG